MKNGKESLKEFADKTAKTIINTQYAETVEPVKSALHNFAESMRTKYPNSDWIRMFTIDTDRIIMDKVKGKAGFFHKLKVKWFMKKNGIKAMFKG